MKYFARIMTLGLAFATSVLGTPLKRDQVAADAKWLVHVDVDKLRGSSLGPFIKQMLDAQTGPFKAQFDFDLDWTKISSLTAYGSSYQSMPDFNGVVLLNTELPLQKTLDGAIEKMSQDKAEGSGPIQKSQKGQATVYSIHDTICVSFEPGKPVLIGKSHDAIEKAAEVLSGKSPNLASTRTFSDFPDSKKAFFLVAAAEAFNLSKQLHLGGSESEDGNPKAKILKLTDGGRVMLGEEANQLILDLALKAQNEEVVTQMQQVVQGMIALGSLSQTDNQDWQQLAQSAKVSAAGKIVSLQVAYPADKALQMLNDHMNGFGEHKKKADGSEGHRKKHKPKNPPQPEEPNKTDDK